jgi:hypothetical protein
MLNLKNINSFKKKVLLKSLYRHNMQPDTITGREYKGKIYVEDNKTSSRRIRNHLKSRIRILIRKKSFRIHNTDLENHLSPQQTHDNPFWPL